jgi:hypothetical protein
VTQPVFGAASNSGNGTNGRGVLTAGGGYIRETLDGGQTWGTEEPGEPWRIRDVHFIDDSRGWMVGQFYRIARTIDAGDSWQQDVSGATFGLPFLNAIVFDSGPNVGVAVGDFDDPAAPKIMFLDDPLNQMGWATPSTIISDAAVGALVGATLREVDWAGGQVFWAAGNYGLMYRSDPTLGPDLWTQFYPNSFAEIMDFSIEGVSFSGTTDGLFVGQRPIASVPKGKAYHYHESGGGLFTWSEVAVPSDVVLLTDVDIVGSTAYAVGHKEVSGIPIGVVLQSTFSGGSFGTFTQVHTVNACDAGEALGMFPILNEVEVDPGGNVWVAGECGRVWRGPGGSSWLEKKSQTDSNVRGMSFPGADLGFLACHRSTRTGHCIVRVVP